jgi:hypothetical protein
VPGSLPEVLDTLEAASANPKSSATTSLVFDHAASTMNIGWYTRSNLTRSR